VGACSSCIVGMLSNVTSLPSALSTHWLIIRTLLAQAYQGRCELNSNNVMHLLTWLNWELRVFLSGTLLDCLYSRWGLKSYRKRSQKLSPTRSRWSESLLLGDNIGAQRAPANGDFKPKI